MSRYTTLSLILLAMAALFTSCMSDDDDTTYTDYCYISSFSLGSVKRTVYTKTASGKDSTYSTAFSASTYYPMTIDQRNLTIENLDSMPFRTRVSAVLATVGYEGVLAWRKKDLTNTTDTTWQTYSSTDSLDFSEPLEFVCFSNKGDSYRKYTVKVNVHQEKGDTMVWASVEAPDMSNVAQRKLTVANGQLILLGQQSDGTVLCTRRPLGTTDGWETLESTTGATNADLSTLCQQNGTLYMSTTDGQVINSVTGTSWSSLGTAKEGLKLIAVSNARLYAICNGSIVSSEDASEWKEESLDAAVTYLPTTDINGIVTTQSNGNRRILLVGNTENGKHAVVWSKAWDDTENETDAQWMYYTENGAIRCLCPRMDNLNVQPYDDGLIAFGSASADGKYAAMDSLFYSPDYGVTWKPSQDDDENVDDRLKSQAANAQYITSAVDENNFLWVLVDDHLWRGRINRLGFLRQDK